MEHERPEKTDAPGYNDPDDALVRGRREAVEQEEDEQVRTPGVTETMESWERERRMDPDSHDQPRRDHERPLSADELPGGAEETQG